MAVLQHYYTSFSNPITGSVGFQCKAMSPGITSDDQNTLNSLIGYRIPPSLVDHPITDHPAALRYIYINPEKCMLVCSQSNGYDENGRPGNFFAHSMITTPKDFEVFPPIMYWRHPFWRIKDESQNQLIPPLPVFDKDPSLEFESIWPFLADRQRRDWFYKLLCAVLQYDQVKRPIVILDSVDHVALWTLAVTVALPQIYRHFISFSTYHHDPYAGLFLITGTTADSKFRFSADEYISYFLLNTEQNRISEIPDSVYARYVCEHFEPDLYESKLLDLFRICNERLPVNRPLNMNAMLTAITNFYMAVRDKSLMISNPQVQESLRGFLNAMKSHKNLNDEEQDDLFTIADMLGQQVVRTPELSIIQDYGNALRLMKRCHPKYASHAREDMQFLTRLVLQGKEDIVTSLLSTYNDIYSRETIVQTLSQSDYLSNLKIEAAATPLDIQNLIWKYLMPLIRLDVETKPYVHSLLKSALRTSQIDGGAKSLVPSPGVDHFLTTLCASNYDRQRFLLEGSIFLNNAEIAQAQRWFYYKLVENLPLAQRTTFRNLEKSVEPNIEQFEVRRDILKCTLRQIIPTLIGWIDHLQNSQDALSTIVEYGLDAAWSMVTEDQRQIFAQTILSTPSIISNLGPQWCNQLVSIYFTSTSFQILEQVPLKLYEKYLTHPVLNPDQRAIIGGSLAMTTGRFYEGTPLDIQRFLSRVDPKTYEIEARRLIERFFLQKIRLETHIDLLQSTYVGKYESTFWQLYWTSFKLLMLDQARLNEFINLLSFWFDESLQVFSDTPYVGQGFFLQLPMVIDEARNDKSFSRVASLITNNAVNRPWYYLVDQYFTGKKTGGLLGFLGKK